MKPIGCEHENAVIRALRAGEWTQELRLHVEACQDCTQALDLAKVLQQQARQAEMRCNVPDAHWILERSRRRARQLAVVRMSRALFAVRILAAGCAAAVLAWLARGYAESQYHEVTSAMHGGAGSFALLGVATAVVCVAVGLLPILGQGAARR